MLDQQVINFLIIKQSVYDLELKKANNTSETSKRGSRSRKLPANEYLNCCAIYYSPERYQ